jgi:hypothetical protein
MVEIGERNATLLPRKARCARPQPAKRGGDGAQAAGRGDSRQRAAGAAVGQTQKTPLSQDYSRRADRAKHRYRRSFENSRIHRDRGKTESAALSRFPAARGQTPAQITATLTAGGHTAIAPHHRQGRRGVCAHRRPSVAGIGRRPQGKRR